MAQKKLLAATESVVHMSMIRSNEGPSHKSVCKCVKSINVLLDSGVGVLTPKICERPKFLLLTPIH